MANKHRGEIEAELGGETYVLCLTLGALADHFNMRQAYGIVIILIVTSFVVILFNNRLLNGKGRLLADKE